MALIDTPDQAELAASVRQLVAAHAPLSKTRSNVDGGDVFDPALWRRLADLGLPGLLVPEEHGGAGGSHADLAAALRELGYGLVPCPLVPSLLVAEALLQLDDQPLRKELLPQLAAGSLIGALAVSEPGTTSWIPDHPATTATSVDDGVVLDGTKRAVVFGAQADVLLVHAQLPDRTGLFVVRVGAPGLEVTAENGLDHVQPTAAVVLRGTPAQELLGDTTAALERVADLANVAVACGQSGGIKRALETTSDYARMRYSFGQPIGSYQGVKHKLADICTEWCLLDALTRRAVEALDQHDPEASTYAAAARVLGSPAFVNAAKQMMMLHGGIGFTWEHDAHFFYKHAVGESVLWGGLPYQRARLAESLRI